MQRLKTLTTSSPNVYLPGNSGTFVFGLHELFLNPEKKNGEAVV